MKKSRLLVSSLVLVFCSHQAMALSETTSPAPKVLGKPSMQQAGTQQHSGKKHHRMTKLLDLTTKQQQAMTALREKYNARMQQQRQVMMQSRQQLMALIAAETLDQAAMDAIVSEQAEQYKQRLVERIQMQREMTQLLTPAQRAKLKNFQQRHKTRRGGVDKKAM